MERLRREHGFTLVELLVVVLILGVLAAMAFPALLNQRSKAQDAAAKSNARNLMSHMEACFTEEDRYTGCTARLTAASTGLDIGSGPGQVQVTAEGATAYTVVATSHAVNGGANHTFTIAHDVATGYSHDCTVRSWGGCPSDGRW